MGDASGAEDSRRGAKIVRIQLVMRFENIQDTIHDASVAGRFSLRHEIIQMRAEPDSRCERGRKSQDEARNYSGYNSGFELGRKFEFVMRAEPMVSS